MSKRLKWVDNDAVELINKGQFDVAFHFVNPETSKSGMVSGWKFEKPAKFDEEMNIVKKTLKTE